MIAAVAVVGKKNELLFLETFPPSSSQSASLRFHFLAHSALDTFDERRARRPLQSSSSSSSSSANDMFLGHLCPIEEFRVYGYQSSTQVKRLVCAFHPPTDPHRSSTHAPPPPPPTYTTTHNHPSTHSTHPPQKTKIKFLAILTENEPVREAEIKGVLQGLHTLYVSYLQSPFSPLTGKVVSDRFSKGVERQVSIYNQSEGGGMGEGGVGRGQSSMLLTSTSSLGASMSSTLPPS